MEALCGALLADVRRCAGAAPRTDGQQRPPYGCHTEARSEPRSPPPPPVATAGAVVRSRRTLLWPGRGAPPLWHPPRAARAAVVTNQRRPRAATPEELDGGVWCSSTACGGPARTTPPLPLLPPLPSAARRGCGGVCRAVAASTVGEVLPGVPRPAAVDWHTGGRDRTGFPAPSPPAHCFGRRRHGRGRRGPHRGRPSSSWHRWPTRSGAPTRADAGAGTLDGPPHGCRTAVCRHTLRPSSLTALPAAAQLATPPL